MASRCLNHSRVVADFVPELAIQFLSLAIWEVEEIRRGTWRTLALGCRGPRAYIDLKQNALHVPQKLDATSQSRQVLPFSSKKNPDFLLRLQLQKEVDRLAVLLEEVRKQTDRVQTAADAIGDRFLSEGRPDTSSPAGQGDGRAPLKTESGA